MSETTLTAETTRRYHSDGYAHLPAFIPREVAIGLLARMKADLAKNSVSLDQLKATHALLRQPAVELYGHHYAPLNDFLWGMTPAIEQAVAREVLPTYAYFRLYRQGDICRFHGDRLSCEHSVSLTLAYSDDIPWAIEVSRRRTETPHQRSDDHYRDDEDVGSVAMEAGDAVLYQGVHHHHGRCTPNPNRWSAHLFLHWVERDGRYAEYAFDGQRPPERIEF